MFKGRILPPLIPPPLLDDEKRPRWRNSHTALFFKHQPLFFRFCFPSSLSHFSLCFACYFFFCSFPSFFFRAQNRTIEMLRAEAYCNDAATPVPLHRVSGVAANDDDDDDGDEGDVDLNIMYNLRTPITPRHSYAGYRKRGRCYSILRAPSLSFFSLSFARETTSTDRE